MAMLAEGKRRNQSFALQPRGKPLYEDSNSFGSKMLTKMGWEPGKGLGANEDGKLDFIKVKYKNDIEGIGFEARDDQWTQHEDGFNKLLQTLSNTNSQQNSDEEDTRPVKGFATTDSLKVKSKYKPSGESLEQKSKTSRARVHYKKFTRGKDLSQYSEKDLANIFGKKVSEKGEAVTLTPPSQESASADETFVPSEFTTTSALSLSDYFKMKMKNKNQMNTIEAEAESTFEKPQKKRKPNKIDPESEVVIEEVEEVVVNKNKKSKKRKECLEMLPAEGESSTVEMEIQLKKKRKDKLAEAIEHPEPIEIQYKELSKKPKKRKKAVGLKEVIVKKKNRSKSSNPEEPSPNVISIQPNSLKQSEIEFNRVRAEQICSYLQNCQRMMAQTTLTLHPITAELIRNANISKFRSSNISQIMGYGLTHDVGLEVLKDVKVNLAQMLKETVTGENPNLIIF